MLRNQKLQDRTGEADTDPAGSGLWAQVTDSAETGKEQRTPGRISALITEDAGSQRTNSAAVQGWVPLL